MSYTANENRYQQMQYRRSGKSGIQLPAISLGLWQNFGDVDDINVYRQTLITAFDNGITHFDLANNYGPPGGSAETNFGKVFKENFTAYRDEMLISTKAGYYMWPGPYGEWGSKKYLVSSLDQSLKRMGLDYVDIFYHHRPDPNTPLEESMMALDAIVRQGKALYAGISNYPADTAAAAFKILKQLGTPCLIHQPRFSMLDRWVENKNDTVQKNLLEVVDENGVGCIVFSPLAQGLLTDKYLKGIPADSRVGRHLPNGALTEKGLDETVLKKIAALNELAKQRNQTMAQMAIAWLLKDQRITSVLVGASSSAQLLNSIDSIKNIEFSKEELEAIEAILK
ncbi:L-glyceraldehyde 3-phosphate reductase [Ferruginibacter sp. SUN106]|uniref:L-glyceraldehyde 3-phosphate reductase n=1 Tax=Ferruginibacter sp. SUN106 TaxID=2978348 RepID=UPI003D36FD1C